MTLVTCGISCTRGHLLPLTKSENHTLVRRKVKSLLHTCAVAFQMGDRTCPPEDFRCTSGQCIAGHLRCNGLEDCADGSDEGDACPKEAATCDPLTQFDCTGDGSNCIDVDLVCNHFNDCGAGEDEKTDVCAKSGASVICLV